MKLLNKKTVGLSINYKYSGEILVRTDQNLEAETEGVDEESDSMELTNLSSQNLAEMLPSWNKLIPVSGFVRFRNLTIKILPFLPFAGSFHSFC